MAVLTMLVIDNATVHRLLDMPTVMDALQESYLDLAAGRGTCRPRIDVAMPTGEPGREYRWGTMEGGSTRGYFAIRMKSDVMSDGVAPDGTPTREKFCGRPGLFLGLILLTSTRDGMPLALIQDGELQHMRVGGDGGLGVRHMAREDAEVVGMLGSGGMADSHMLAFCAARTIRRLQVYSPTRTHRESFAARMAGRHGIEAVACDDPADVYRGADIVAALTDAARPVLDGDLLEPGTHVVNVGGGGLPDARTLERVDVCLRLGDAPAADGMAPFDDEYLTWSVREGGKPKSRGHGAQLSDRRVSLADLVSGARPGRTSPDQITWSERGNVQGAQFHAVAGRVFEAARAEGGCHDIPDDWLLQDIRN